MNSKVMVARKERHLTQQQLAEQAGLTPHELVLIERHGWIPPRQKRERLAEALEQTADELFGVVQN